MTSEPTSFAFNLSQPEKDNNNRVQEDEEVQTIQKLQFQAKRLEVRACIYFLCFFLIVLSAYFPFMAFQKLMHTGIEQGLAYLTPLLLGISLTMGMVVAVLALVLLMSAQSIQKEPIFQVDANNTSPSSVIANRIKKLHFISRFTLLAALLAMLINITLVILG